MEDDTARRERVGRGLAYACQHAADICDQLARHGSTAPLDDLMSAARDGRDVAGLLDALHEALQAGGDALGVYGNARATASRLTGIPAPRPTEVLYLCPRRRCLRYSWPGGTSDAPPSCGIDGEPMLRSRL
jgi:hypothetical protein